MKDEKVMKTKDDELLDGFEVIMPSEEVDGEIPIDEEELYFLKRVGSLFLEGCITLMDLTSFIDTIKEERAKK